MDPFNEDSENLTGWRVVFQFGQRVSEDVLNDSQLGYENGLPSANNPDLPTLDGVWGTYPDPATFNVVNAFDNTSGDYLLQDVGLDGLPDSEEQSFFGEWLNEVSSWLNPDAYQDVFSRRPFSGQLSAISETPQAQSAARDHSGTVCPFQWIRGQQQHGLSPIATL